MDEGWESPLISSGKDTATRLVFEAVVVVSRSFLLDAILECRILMSFYDRISLIVQANIRYILEFD